MNIPRLEIVAARLKDQLYKIYSIVIAYEARRTPVDP